ncbi:MAG: hypothetical protein KGL39_50925 [Patescibacteria group bacterium]|nr:hypothetical protein [Patescibacteria group bacterium]
MVVIAGARIDEAEVQFEGPFAFSITIPDGGCDNSSTIYMLKREGGEWLLDEIWIAQGKVDRFDVLARALRKLEAFTSE